MFERFTERARQVVVLAQDEARALRHDHIGTEHILLGLLREEQGIGARVLESIGITVEEIRAQVVRTIGLGDTATTGQMPFTPVAKRTLEMSLREALELDHDYIGTEHLLLGLAHVNEGTAARILWDRGIGSENLREAVLATLSGEPVPPAHERRGAAPHKRSERVERPSIVVRGMPASRHWIPALVAGIFLAIGLAIGVLLGWAIWN